jgi:sterol O-acyltransferase
MDKDKNHRNSLTYSKTRSSFLDLSDSSSGIHKADLRGFYIMFILISGFYILISSLNKFFSVGYFVEDSFFWAMVSDGKYIMMIWPGVFIYSWLGYVLQLLILKGLPLYLSTILQHLTQSIMFIAATYIVLNRDMGFSQSLYIILLTFVHFMKMHSYTVVNRDLRKNYLKDSKNSDYPHNLTVKNYFSYLVTPVLVYQIQYPRIPKFRSGYFVLKAVLLLAELVCLYMIITENMLDTIKNCKDLSFLDVYIRLIIPCLVSYNLLFLIVFEQILNLFGELSLFGDREFYQDWWNSDGFEDFSRKWNRPVHFFLYQHVYLEARNQYKCSQETAKLITFLFSALCHEFLVALLSRTIRPYLFGLMMFQIPLILFNKLVNTREFGLYLFWTGIITGPPLLLTLYAKL